MKNVFGYPEFDAEGEEILCTYDNAYSDMLMDIRVYRMEPGRKRCSRTGKDFRSCAHLETIWHGF